MAQTVRQQLKWGVQLGAGICLLGQASLLAPCR